MTATLTAETAVPVFPCGSPEETLEFYQLLGFEVTYKQLRPYVYLAIRRGGFDLNFYSAGKSESEKTSAGCLVIVDDVASYHQTFADALRDHYGRVPISGEPRITRFRPGQTRFTLVDPHGNWIMFVRRDEKDVDYNAPKQLAGLEKSIETAKLLRDFKTDDEAAAKVLDVGLAKFPDASPADRARALAARAEIAVALDDVPRAQALAAQLKQLKLSAADRKLLKPELEAAANLERWLKSRD